MPESWRADAFLPLATDALFILLALASRPQHGYGIIRDVEDRSARETVLQTGALYRMLRRLLRDELIEACDPPADEGGDPRRRYYRLTRRGRLVLEAEVDRMARLVRAARLTDAGKRPRFI
ncbi:MAG: helix-turn-helix transcriptional regulator [Vicinamibacterales bacterium]